VRVVVTHGWIADHTLFDPFIDCIDRARFTYAFLDCRGYGTRRDEPGLCTMDTVAAEVRAVTSRLGWPRFHVIGHSMGGMVAQRLMVDVPDRLASVILLAPVPASGARLDATRRALLQRAIIEPAARRALITANTGGIRPREWIEAILQLSLRSTQADALAPYLESWSGTDFSREVRNVDVPVQLITGDLDPGAPLARMHETILQWYPRAEFHRLTGVGHYPMREEPRALHALIEPRLLDSVQ
jgi:pimeloyl-ACP methyl ester carboxylesterase